MGFLAPLYITGLLALSLPLIFHLIRRTPRSRRVFSTVMFLSPSPPRLTRRSRLDQWLLLLLRAAVLALLVFAFARPFFRQQAALDFSGRPSRQVAILVDTSASMQQAQLWPRAVAEVERLLKELRPSDQAALYTFDDHLRVLLDFDQREIPLDRRNELIRGQLHRIKPGWGGTDLGGALVRLADTLNALAERSGVRSARHEIILVSDLQQGSQLEALQAFQWPRDVHLSVKSVQPSTPTNAGLQIVEDRGSAGEDYIRVRITNSPLSQKEQFTLRWSGLSGERPVMTYIPPGQSKVVRVPRPKQAAEVSRLVLRGDDHAFDNTLYVSPLERRAANVVYFGPDSANDPDGLSYYLQRALMDIGGTVLELQKHEADQAFQLGGTQWIPLVVLAQAVPQERVEELRRYVREGGTLLCVLADAGMAESLSALLPENQLAIEEARLPDYRMLGYIDFKHPLFSALSDPRFSDFTKVQFWRYRRVQVEEEGDLQVVARFDNGDPALLERREGTGTILVLTSGWHRADSLLGRSSKFIPLLYSALERGGAVTSGWPQYEVNQAVALHGQAAGDSHVVFKPDGQQVGLRHRQRAFADTSLPGLYRAAMGQREHFFAVNVAAAESATAPLELEQLEQLGVLLAEQVTPVQAAERYRQMRSQELESRQRLWKWLLVATLALIVLETWWAGKASRHSSAAEGGGA